MPASASFSSTNGLVERYIASRNAQNANSDIAHDHDHNAELEHEASAYDPSSSPTWSSRGVGITSSTSYSTTNRGRPTPVIIDLSSPRATTTTVSHIEEYGEHEYEKSIGNGNSNGLLAPRGLNAPGAPNETSLLLGNGGRGYSPASCVDETDWRKELHVLSGYTLPGLGTQGLEYSLSIASVISIGHISTDALAAVTLSSMTASVTGFSLLVGFSTALDTMLPSAWTSATPSLVGLWSLRMLILMAMLMVPILIIWTNAEHILLFLRQEPEIARLAGIYLRWFSLGLPAYGANAILRYAVCTFFTRCLMVVPVTEAYYRRFFQSQGLFSVPTRILFIVAPTNVALNYILVWGPDWIRLGFIGAPIATAISMNLITICYFVYGIAFAPRTAWHPFTRECFHDLGFLFKISCAGVIQTATEWWCWEGIALAASQIGPISLAVQSVLLVSATTSYQFPSALSAATSVRLGNMLGARSAKGAALATRVSLGLSVAIMATLGLIFFIFRKTWAFIFNDDSAVVKEVAHIMPLVAMFQILDGLEVVTGAILRAKGQQDIGGLLNIIGYYVIGIPLALLLAFKFDMGLMGLWLGLTFALLFCAFSGLYSTDWEKEVKKTADRLAQDDNYLDTTAV